MLTRRRSRRGNPTASDRKLRRQLLLVRLRTVDGGKLGWIERPIFRVILVKHRCGERIWLTVEPTVGRLIEVDRDDGP
jgi:hypothetical protein